MELQPLRVPRFQHVSHHALGIRIVRVHQQGDHAGMGNRLGKELWPLGHQLDCHDADAGEVAAGPGETGDEAVLNRVAAGKEDDRNRRGRVFRRDE
jgi:hypothetical protein